MAPNNVEIIEQPAERLFRFRYESEGRNGGSILGVSSTRDISTFPKIRVNNYIGPIAVYISCVTNETKCVIFEFDLIPLLPFPIVHFETNRFFFFCPDQDNILTNCQKPALYRIVVFMFANSTCVHQPRNSNSMILELFS